MKLKYTREIDGRAVIWMIVDAAIDSEKTKAAIETRITPEMTEEQVKELYMRNLVYASVGEEAEFIDDTLGESLTRKLQEKGENQELLDDGYDYIPNYTGVEYWIKESGRWNKEKIEKIGQELPGGAVLPDQLTGEQSGEISAQTERDRIAALTPEEKAEERRSKLYALAREANQKADDADLLGEPFDKQAWLLPKKEEIDKKYA